MAIDLVIIICIIKYVKFFNYSLACLRKQVSQKTEKMAKANDFGCGLTHELAITAAKAGWEPRHMSLLAENEGLMVKILTIINGDAEVFPVIDCDSTPRAPDGWHLYKHHKMGTIPWMIDKVELYSAENKETKFEDESAWQILEASGKKRLNANALWYLLKRPHLIPESWKGVDNDHPLFIHFLGTIFCTGSVLFGIGNMNLHFKDGKWIQGYSDLYDLTDFTRSNHFVAMYKI